MKRLDVIPFLLVLCGLLIGVTAQAFGYTVSDFGTRIEDMYREYAAQMPKRNRIYVCTNDCMGDPRFFRYSGKDIARLRAMIPTTDPVSERAGIAKSVKWMENRIGHTGNSCTGSALNVTSHILVLHANGILKHHRPHKPMGKLCLPKWPHWSGMIRANDRSGTVWAIDTYLDKSRVIVQPFSEWYCR